ncbi:hypothetical protein K8T06_09920 [bacterium]|nr:hypothetical protein [bacterium]
MKKIFFYFTVSLVCYSWTLNALPVLDDYMHFFVFDNTDFSTLSCIADSANWSQWIRPVYWTLFCFERWILVDHYILYRLISLCIYSLTIVLFINTITLFLGISRLTALISGLLIVIYPGNFQTVLWMTSLHELLFYLFFLISFNLAFRWLENSHHWGFLMGSAGFYLLALGSKETSVIMPVFATVLILYKNNSRNTNKKISTARITTLVGTFVVLTIIYFAYRYNVLTGIGGYKESSQWFPTDVSQFLSLLYTVFVVVPAQYLMPLAYESKTFLKYVLPGIASVFYLGILLPGIIYRSRQSLMTIILMVLFIALVIVVIWTDNAHSIAPRYLYAGSFWFCLLLVTVWSQAKRKIIKMGAPLILISLWIPLLFTNQNTYCEAGEITDQILDELELYCSELATGTQIIVTGIPGKIGAINVEHPHTYLNVFNLEIQRRCHLNSQFDPCHDLGASQLDQYFQKAPGIVSTISTQELDTLLADPMRSQQIVLHFDQESGLHIQ